MKILQDYTVSDRLRLSDTGPEAAVGDLVKLFLNTQANPAFPAFIYGVVQHPIVRVNCDNSTAYDISYNETDLLGSAAFIRPGDVIDATVTVGPADHAVALNRSSADAHPISAITGLVTALAAKVSTSSLGTGVSTALALPIGTNGAAQRQGDPLTPTSIIVPDMTTVVPPSGAIGLKYGQLSLGDGAKMGGNEINPLRRIRGSYRFSTGVQPITGAFTRVAALPIFPTDIPSISNTSVPFVVYGSIRFSSPSYYSQQIKDLGIGFCFNDDSLTAKSAGKWMYASAHPTPGTGTRLNFVDVSVGWFGAFSPFGFPDFAIGGPPEVSCVGSVYSAGSDPVITYPSAVSTGFPKVTSATSAKMWLMLHGEKATGQVVGGFIDIKYDLTLDFL